ncbi:MAG: T9SS type A sorting domain-containing protein [Chitinophagaceae bacterium]|nr:T9SS type A sorting domain-containing protein [Chitinophagaceae bacterium]
MKEKFTFLLSIVSFPCLLFSQTPVWSTDIAPIIYGNCTSCHHEGAIAPFSLMTYDAAVTYGFSIQTNVNAHKMPPWPPDPDYSHFRDEKVLTEAELTAINNWVDGGMPAGDLNQAPEPPVYNGFSSMQQIDDTVHMPVYEVTEEVDDFRTFVVHSGYAETKFVNQIEIIPGDFSMVHHLLMFQDSTNISFTQDSLSPGPGYPSDGAGVSSQAAELIGGWIPGSDLLTLPPNMGFRMPAGTDYVLAFHYAPNSLGKTDSTKVNLRFIDSTNVRTVTVPRYLYWHLPSLIDGPLYIPANQVKAFHEQSQVFTTDLSLLALQPHCHLIGKSWKIFMVTAPGDTTNLIYIPNWNFNWQMCYFFNKIIKIPAGAQIFGEAVFDNTINNPNNPFNPPQNISAGEATTAEMMSARFWVIDYQPGDEDIILDSSFYTSDSESISVGLLPLKVIPNPVEGQLHFLTTLPEHEIDWTITNQIGLIVKSKHLSHIPKGAYTEEADVSGLSPGIYILTVASGNETASTKIIITE